MTLPLTFAIHILRKMPRKSDESSVECCGHGFLIAGQPRRGIEHYSNWVCRSTTSLRERCEWLGKVGENVSKQCRSARPVRHQSSARFDCETESRSMPAQSKANNLHSLHWHRLQSMSLLIQAHCMLHKLYSALCSLILMYSNRMQHMLYSAPGMYS